MENKKLKRKIPKSEKALLNTIRKMLKVKIKWL
jgi:hypothetical protein